MNRGPRTRARAVALGMWIPLATSCSLAVSYPSPEPEDSLTRCLNGVDDDLDGLLDCAEASCADFCPVAEAVEGADLLPCFDGAASGATFVAQLGEQPQDARCRPWGPDGTGEVVPPTCPEGELAFPGQSECAPIGAPCPEPGRWPAGAPVGAIHVSMDAPVGGDGSVAAPYATIAEGVAAAPDGGEVWIGPGLYVEPVRLDRSITLRGVCESQVHVWSDDPRGVVRIAAAGAVLRDVSVGLERPSVPTPVAAGVVVEADARDAQVTSVSVGDVQGAALEVGARGVQVHALHVSNLRGSGSVGVLVDEDAELTLSRWRIDGGAGDGLRVAGELGASGGWIGAVAGRGVEVSSTASATLEGVGLAALGGLMEVSCGAGAGCLNVADLWADAAGGPGITLRSGSMTLTRAFVAKVRGAALHVTGGVAVVTDVVFSGARADGGVPGAGVRVEREGTLRGDHLLLRGNLLYGIESLDGTLQLSHLMVDGRVPSGTSAVGLRLVGGAASIQNFSIDQAGICGMELVDFGEAVLREGVISHCSRGICVSGGEITAGQLMPFIKVTGDVRSPLFVEQR